MEKEPANLRELIRRIQPSVQDLPKIRDKKARMREAVLNNVRYQVHQLRQEPVIQAAAGARQIKVIGAFYEIGSGAVDFLDREGARQPAGTDPPHPAQRAGPPEDPRQEGPHA
ncbi:hypothetical protein CTI14_55335, partial [Methylobacterium radiotolerans]